MIENLLIFAVLFAIVVAAMKLLIGLFVWFINQADLPPDKRIWK